MAWQICSNNWIIIIRALIVGWTRPKAYTFQISSVGLTASVNFRNKFFHRFSKYLLTWLWFFHYQEQHVTSTLYTGHIEGELVPTHMKTKCSNYQFFYAQIQNRGIQIHVVLVLHCIMLSAM